MTLASRTVALFAALGLAASFSIAAADGDCYVAIENDPTTTEDDVLACEQQTWFHRPTTHVANAGYVEPAHGIATFDTTPPAGSVTGGNGGGYAAWSTLLVGGDDALTDARFEGTYTGVLDRLDVDLHMLVDSFSRLGVPQTLDIDVLINGAAVFSAGEVEVTGVTEENSSAGSLRLDFAITGLAEHLASFGYPNGPDATHEVTLVVGAFYLDQVTIFAFDTTEVPGGIGFNRKDIPAGTTEIKA